MSFYLGERSQFQRGSVQKDLRLGGGVDGVEDEVVIPAAGHDELAVAR